MVVGGEVGVESGNGLTRFRFSLSVAVAVASAGRREVRPTTLAQR